MAAPDPAIPPPPPSAARAPAPDIVLRCQNIHRFLGTGEGRVHVLRGVTFEARRS